MKSVKKDLLFKYERCLQEQLISLEKLFTEHYISLQSTLNDQKVILDPMWVLSQRFLILTRGTICVCPYPKEITIREAREITAEFNSKKKLIQESNLKLNASLYSLKEKCEGFDRASRKLDARVPGKLFEINQKSVYYHIELLADLVKFFHELQNKLSLMARFFIVDDIGSLREYKQLLVSDTVVNEYLENFLGIENKAET